MYCKFCGGKLTSSQRVCPSCGKEQGDFAQTNSRPASSEKKPIPDGTDIRRGWDSYEMEKCQKKIDSLHQEIQGLQKSLNKEHERNRIREILMLVSALALLATNLMCMYHIHGIRGDVKKTAVKKAVAEAFQNGEVDLTGALYRAIDDYQTAKNSEIFGKQENGGESADSEGSLIQSEKGTGIVQESGDSPDPEEPADEMDSDEGQTGGDDSTGEDEDTLEGQDSMEENWPQEDGGGNAEEYMNQGDGENGKISAAYYNYSIIK